MFFGYEMRIVEHLRERGAHAEYLNERPGASSLAKMVVRSRSRFLRVYARKYYARALGRLKGATFDDILLISPEACQPETIRQFRQHFPGVRLILYMWDSFTNKGITDPRTFIGLFDRALTFDDSDAAAYSIGFRPLFFCSKRECASQAAKYAFSFAGTIHSDRYRVLKRLGRTADTLGMSYFIFPFLPSRMIYWFYLVTKREFRGTRPGDFRFVPMPYSEIQETFASSIAIVDVQHPGQRGLTMRTMEALGSGKKLITTNKHIATYPFFSPDRVLVIDRKAPILTPDFLRAPTGSLDERMLASYSLESWVNAILLDRSSPTEQDHVP
jgi:hypothetical protein